MAQIPEPALIIKRCYNSICSGKFTTFLHSVHKKSSQTSFQFDKTETNWKEARLWTCIHILHIFWIAYSCGVISFCEIANKKFCKRGKSQNPWCTGSQHKMLSMKIQLNVSSGNFPFIYVDSTLHWGSRWHWKLTVSLSMLSYVALLLRCEYIWQDLIDRFGFQSEGLFMLTLTRAMILGICVTLMSTINFCF